MVNSFYSILQSDIVHQSVYELVHSEDREELQRQLMWNSFLPPESANIGLQDVLLPENRHLLERSFTVRFRCLLDNTSGFLVIFYIMNCTKFTSENKYGMACDFLGTKNSLLKRLPNKTVWIHPLNLHWIFPC